VAGANLDAHGYAQASRGARCHSEQGPGTDIYRLAQRENYLGRGGGGRRKGKRRRRRRRKVYEEEGEEESFSC